MRLRQAKGPRFCRLRAIGTVALGVGIGLALTLALRFAGSDSRISGSGLLVSEGSDDGRGTGGLREGHEMVLVYVGSSRCGWSNRLELVRTVQELKGLLAVRADSAGVGFTTVGVARDMVANEGLEHLAKYGRFDEVMAGRSWLNIGIQKYLYGDLPGPGATPQVLLLMRSVDYRAGHTGIDSERVLERRAGLDQIVQWVEGGAPTEALLADSGEPAGGN